MGQTPKEQINTIVDQGYGVNSGVYSVVNPSIEMGLDIYGQYGPYFTEDLTDADYERLAKVDTMSDYSPDESELAKRLFHNQDAEVRHDNVLGYYTSLYAGHVVGGGYRKRASSGGLTSWVLVELMKQRLVDGVIHIHAVDPDKNDGKLFKYVVSTSIKEINKGAKSRYYPGELSEVLQIVKSNPRKKYAIVGIPEFITEVRLLAEVDEQIKNQIVFTVGLVCGHQKSAKYVEALAWQNSIKPGNLIAADFRIKQPKSTAIDYLHKFTGRVDGRETTFTRGHKDLFCGSWAHGLFKAKFSDFTDNVFNEVADIVLGDAWLPEYDEDGMGNNIVIIRNAELDQIVKLAIREGALKLDIVDVETIKQSQKGLIHHERDELPYRIERQRAMGYWVPKKRFTNGKIPLIRRQIQDLRYEMATTSHEVYRQAVERGDWAYFEERMLPIMDKYKQLYMLNGDREAQLQKESIVQSVLSRIRSSLRIRTRFRAAKHKLRLRTRYRQMLTGRTDKKKQKEMMRGLHGAILTLTGYFNYGNILQRYALQEYLRQKGYSFVSYAREPLDTNDPRLKNTSDFVKRYIRRKQFDENDRFPAYIVGSDQVWRNWGMPKEQGDILYYFYDFLKDAKANRIAYAASFGVDNFQDAQIDDNLAESIRPLVKKFDAISMRERAGVDMVKKMWGEKADVVVDPTMLLTKDEYSQLVDASEFRLESTPLVFSYVLAISDEKRRLVDRLAAEFNGQAELLHPKELEVLPPVEQWLQGFRDSKFVVTDSFHGTVFAIINNTPFVVIENEYGGVARIVTLLDSFGLKDRVIAEKDIGKFQPSSLRPIEWEDVNKRLLELRRSSGEWLLSAVAGGGT